MWTAHHSEPREEAADARARSIGDHGRRAADRRHRCPCRGSGTRCARGWPLERRAAMIFATCAPPCIATCATPGHRLAVLADHRREVADDEHLGMAGHRADRARPRRGRRGRAARRASRAERRRLHAGGPQHGARARCARRSPAHGHAVGVDAGDQRVRCAPRRRRFSSDCFARLPTASADTAASTRSRALDRITRDLRRDRSCGSRARACAARSRRARRRARRRSGRRRRRRTSATRCCAAAIGSRARPPRTPRRTRRRISSASSIVLRPGRDASPSRRGRSTSASRRSRRSGSRRRASPSSSTTRACRDVDRRRPRRAARARCAASRRTARIG